MQHRPLRNRFFVSFSIALLPFVSAPSAATDYDGLGIHGIHSGPELGLGAALGNPAGGAVLLRKDVDMRSAFKLMGVSLEIGPVDDFADEIEDLEEELDRDGVTQQEADATIAHFNEVLPEIGRAAYTNLGAGSGFSSMARAWDGAVSWSLDGKAETKVSALDAPLVYDSVADELHSDTSLYLRQASFVRLGFAYGQEWQAAWLPVAPEAAWYWGARLNLAYARLHREVLPLESDLEDESVLDQTELSFGRGDPSVGVGADAGVIYRHAPFHTGLTVYNLVPAHYDFNTVGRNCGSLSNAAEQEKCVAAANFPGRVHPRASFTETPRVAAEFVLRPQDTGWSAGASLDLNAGETVFGDEEQWAGLSGGYSPSRFWIPGFVVSYRENLAGSKLSSLGLGLSLFGFLRLDAIQSLDDVRYEGNSYPRSASVTLSFQMPL